MLHEGFGVFALVFAAVETLHRNVPFEDKVGLLAGMSATRLVLGFHHIGNVNVGVGVEFCVCSPVIASW